MFFSKDISEVSSTVNESGNNERCEYDIDEKGECYEHRWGDQNLIG